MSTPLPTSAGAATPSPLAQRWAALQPRERVLVAATGAALGLLLLWMLAVRPAWRQLAQAPAQRAQVDAQLLQVQALVAEARQLQQLPPPPPARAAQVLQSATERLGARASLQLQNGQATLTLKGVQGDELRQWLLEARGGAHARPLDMKLSRSADAWSGTLVVGLGPTP